MNTTAKLAEKAKQALACMRGLQQHLGQSVCEVESQELAAALAAHEQAHAGEPERELRCAYDDMREHATQIEREYKNFHRALCNRFGYFHDDENWQRDLCSLEEHIAGYMGLVRAAQAKPGAWGYAVLSKRAPLIDKSFRRADAAEEYLEKMRLTWEDAEIVPLYTTPQPAQAERVGLTDEQIAEGRYRTWAAEPEDAPEAVPLQQGVS